MTWGPLQDLIQNQSVYSFLLRIWGAKRCVLLKRLFESNYIAPLGPQVDAFEREFAEYVGIPYAVALSSGTAAMHLALRILGVGPGDDVIASYILPISAQSTFG